MRVFLFLIFVLSSTMSTAAPNDEKAKADMMVKFMAASTPGEPHKVLADLAGEFTFTSKSWESADATPMEGKGTATMTMILGGRWLANTMKAEATGHMPAFEGHGMMGYNNVSKKYETIWMDSMSTGSMTGEGSFDSTSKTIKDTGTYMCPLTGKERKYRSTWQVIDKSTTVFALYGTPVTNPKGKEFKMLEVTYKRK